MGEGRKSKGSREAGGRRRGLTTARLQRLLPSLGPWARPRPQAWRPWASSGKGQLCAWPGPGVGSRAGRGTALLQAPGPPFFPCGWKQQCLWGPGPWALGAPVPSTRPHARPDEITSRSATPPRLAVSQSPGTVSSAAVNQTAEHRSTCSDEDFVLKNSCS